MKSSQAAAQIPMGASRFSFYKYDDKSDMTDAQRSSERKSSQNSIYPLAFQSEGSAGDENPYLRYPAVQALVEFFISKGMPALKEEDRLEQWYDDWIAYQHQHGLYATVLSPSQYSTRGNSFDLLRYAQFLEAFAYCSPAHGYSLQVTFLGLFSILMGSNEELKKEAVAELEAGNLLAFGVSEKDHGSDLLGNEFAIAESQAGDLMANGSKYYIGNADTASLIAILGRMISKRSIDTSPIGRSSRAPFMFIALRPKLTVGFQSLGKIRTLGVRAANVGAFEVKNYVFDKGDVIAEGRNAWDAVFGTVTLGKFFLGFGSIGICEHALEEAVTHLRQRTLYGKPAIEMRHIQFNVARAWARLTAMKLYGYRALDYVHAASAADRRYLLFCAVQKARTSTEGLRVMASLQESIGAKGFESDTYFEMALRDVQLIPSLEGSMHINLGLAAQFIPRYFDREEAALIDPPSVVGGEVPSRENEYLMEARTGSFHKVGFRKFLDAYGPSMTIPSVALFAHQAEMFREFTRLEKTPNSDPDLQFDMAMGQCFAAIVYGQLVAENAARLELPSEAISVIFSILVEDLSSLALHLAAIPGLDEFRRQAVLRMVESPRTSVDDWAFVCMRCEGGDSLP